MADDAGVQEAAQERLRLGLGFRFRPACPAMMRSQLQLQMQLAETLTAQKGTRVATQH